MKTSIKFWLVKLLPLILCASGFIPVHAQISYEINVSFFPENAQIHGRSVNNDHFLTGYTKISNIEQDTSDFFLYLHGELEVDSVKLNGRTTSFSSEKALFNYNYSMLATKVGVKHEPKVKSIEVYYSGFMNPSRARSLSDYMYIDKNSGVFLRAYGYSLWFPVLENKKEPIYQANFEKVTTEIQAGYKTIVAGHLSSEKITNGRYSATWEPGLQSIIDIQCTARKFQTINKNNINVYYMDDSLTGKKIWNYTLTLKKLFDKQFRSIDYKPELYIMEMPKYGNISSSNVIGISSDIYNLFDKNMHSKATIAHELIHPYVKIPVEYNSPFAALVYEGFPSFFQIYALSKTTEISEYNVEEIMKEVEKSYLKKRTTGLSERRRKLPPEKPILKINFNEIGTYKDKFILNDRVWLFMYFLWKNMGDKEFDFFTRELFTYKTIDYETFSFLVQRYIPNSGEDIETWLKTTKFPEKFQIIHQ